MTYVPTAYAARYDDRFWVMLTTPSGRIVRLVTSYDTLVDAERALVAYGFSKIEPPKITFTTLNRGNTTPR